MILRIIRLLLVVSCTMFSLMTLADNNTTNKNQDDNVVTIKDTTQVSAPEDTKAPTLVREQANKKADENVTQSSVPATTTITEEGNEKSTPTVGKHAMANMNPASMILSLFLVLGLIIVCGLIFKRFNLTQQRINQLKVVSTLRLGAKERIIVVQVGEQQLLLGVTNQHITLLETLSEPIVHQTMNTNDLPKNILSLFSSK